MAPLHGLIKFATRDLITMRLGEQQLHEALLRSEAADQNSNCLGPKPRQMNALGIKRRTS